MENILFYEVDHLQIQIRNEKATLVDYSDVGDYKKNEFNYIDHIH